MFYGAVTGVPGAFSSCKGTGLILSTDILYTVLQHVLLVLYVILGSFSKKMEHWTWLNFCLMKHSNLVISTPNL